MNKRLKSPINVQVEVTGECGHKCLHCYNFWREKGKRSLRHIRSGMLSEEELASIIWNGLDPEKFVSGLTYRHAVSSVE